MASPKYFSLIVLTCLMSISPSSCSSVDDHGINVVLPSPLGSQVELAIGQKVDLTLYYGPLCPSCASLIDQLVNLMNWDKGFMAIINLRLVPVGNLQILEPNQTFVCQHGRDDCYLNSIEACVINIWPNVKQHLPLFSCIEHLAADKRWYSKENAWRTCCQTHNMSQKPVLKCHNSGCGRQILLQYADEIEHLDPPLSFVPWVVVNERPLYYDYENFASYVCDAYQRYPKPGACRSMDQHSWDSSAATANLTRLYVLYMVLHHLLLFGSIAGPLAYDIIHDQLTLCGVLISCSGDVKIG